MITNSFSTVCYVFVEAYSSIFLLRFSLITWISLLFSFSCYFFDESSLLT